MSEIPLLFRKFRFLVDCLHFLYIVQCMKKRFTSTPGTGFYQKRLAAGLCVQCEAPPTVGPVCLDCWFKMMSWNHLKSRTRGPELREIWERQEGKCVYTGVTLVPGPRSQVGGNASLDHKVPLKRGGSNEPHNLQWTLESINRMKADMLEDEFYKMCETILFLRSEKLRKIQ